MWTLDELSQLVSENPIFSKYVIDNVYLMGKRDAIVKDTLFHYFVEETKEVSDDLRDFIVSSIEGKYPEASEWFASKVLPGLSDGTRRIFLLKCGMEVVGFAITKKKNLTSTKVCSLFVKPYYRRKGCGTRLLQGVLRSFPHKTHFYISFRTSFEEVKDVREFMRVNGFNVRDHLAYARGMEMVDSWYYAVKDDKFF